MRNPGTRHPLALAVGLALITAAAPDAHAQSLAVTDGSTQTASGTYDSQFDVALRAANPGSTIEGDGTTVSSRGAVLGTPNHALLAEDNGRVALRNATIATSGNNVRAAGARRNGTVELTGTAITMATTAGYGLHAEAGGNVSMTGGSIANSEAGYAIGADGTNSRVTATGVAMTSSDVFNGIGARARDGGTIALDGGTLTLADGVALQAIGAGSRVDANGTRVRMGDVTSGDEGTLFTQHAVMASNGGTVRLAAGFDLEVAGSAGSNRPTALLSTGAGSAIEVDAASIVVTDFRDSGHAALARDGGRIDFGNGSRVEMGSTAFGVGPVLRVEGSGSAITTRATSVVGGNGVAVRDGGTATLGAGTTVRVRETGIDVQDAGSEATLEDTVIEVAGGARDAAFGLFVADGGRVTMRGGSIDSNGIAAWVSPDTIARSSEQARLRLENVRVTANEGIYVLPFGEVELIGSTLQTTGHAILTRQENALYPEGSRITVDGGRVASSDEAAVSINARTALTLRNGVQVAGAGDVLVTAYADTDLLVDNAALRGRILGEDDALQARLTNGATLEGVFGNVTGTRYADRGNAWDVDLDAGTGWTLTGDAEVNALTSAGRIGFAAPAGDAFRTLTVRGDYVGENGTLALNTRLGDSASPSDRLVVEGATSGSTTLSIANAGGGGAVTGADGILVVRVDGASNGAFALSGRVVAGAYDYFLHKGGVANPSDGDWYLRSQLSAPPPPTTPPPTTPPPTTPPPTTPPPGNGGGPGAPGGSGAILRPEVGVYLGNQAVALSMFRTQSADRIGAGIDGRDDDARGNGWVRVARSQRDGIVDPGQLDYGADVSTLQLGAGVADFAAGDDGRVRVGAMLSSGRANPRADSRVTGYRAKGEVEGAAAGVYGTWSFAARGGAYLDGWLQYGRYDLSVQGEGLTEERYDARTWSASLEAGYAFALGDAAFIEPQLQAVFTDYRADAHREANGTVVAATGLDGVATRVGVRLYPADATAVVRPYAAVNWWRDDESNALAFDGQGVRADLPRDRYEARAGAALQLAPRWQAWGDLGIARAADDVEDVNAQIGLGYRW